MAKGKQKKGEKKKGEKRKGGYKTVEKQSKASMAPRLRTRYRDEIVSALMKEFEYESVMQVPTLSKIVLNMGLGKEAIANPNVIKTGQVELTQIAGQKAVVTKAKKSISNFKLRAGVAVGCTVTLRNERMWEFLDRLIGVAMPRMRDFKGVSGKSFDGRGNYSMGMREQIVFPEIDYDNIDQIKGLNVTIATSAQTDREGKALLKHLGMPFRN